ncbi:hypothetical protein [Flavobacterium sp.]|uniref:hypothetical protein n=1 Tax=Flavobacterium sp. TaxID=239 RepID=UPI002489B1A5|nr:hypothetical protein [Flavobacterium sp.]MDI1317759.1 hypothetical protein [Flavobacterium sp.]
MINLTKVISTLIFLFFLSLECLGQKEAKNSENILGCWQTIKYTTAKEEVIYPAEIKMIYRFSCDGSYTMIISNSFTNTKKEQKGTFTLLNNTIALVANGEVEVIKDTITFIGASSFKWDVVLENEKGTFQLQRIMCVD